jgi:hypothetical protein
MHTGAKKEQLTRFPAQRPLFPDHYAYSLQTNHLGTIIRKQIIMIKLGHE